MTDNEIRIAVAEACGWTHNEYDASLWYHQDHCPDDKYILVDDLPDYSSSLDAMYEAEKVLTDDKLMDFARWLGWDDDFPERTVKTLLRATARQRCEALLRVLGKWQSSAPTETEKEQ